MKKERHDRFYADEHRRFQSPSSQTLQQRNQEL